ncbi:MAG: glycosyltransferase [Bacteroides uniformis]
MSPNYSVLISVYYKEKPIYLKSALDSVLNQTLPPSEIILIKDGPLTVELEKVLSSYDTNLLKIIPLPNNLGLSKALNIGLKHCSYEFVARMDTDDICYPSRFEKQVLFLQSHPTIDIVGAYATKIDECGNNLEEVIKVPVSHEDIVRLVWTCPLNHPTVMYRKNAILSVGGYKPDAGPRQDDYDLWFRCAEKGLHFANISEPLLHYRFFADSVRKNSIEVGWHRMPYDDKQVYILRPCMIHGPGNKGNLNLLYNVVRKGVPWPLGAFENRRSFTSIDNLCYVVEGLLTKEVASGIYHMGDDEALSTNKLIALMCRALERKPHIWKINRGLMEFCARLGTLLHLPLNEERLHKLTENYVVSNAKIKAALGIDRMPVRAEEGIVRTIKSFSL